MMRRTAGAASQPGSGQPGLPLVAFAIRMRTKALPAEETSCLLDAERAAHGANEKRPNFAAVVQFGRKGAPTHSRGGGDISDMLGTSVTCVSQNPTRGKNVIYILLPI
jgi:hypothetical protein